MPWGVTLGAAWLALLLTAGLGGNEGNGNEQLNLTWDELFHLVLTSVALCNWSAGAADCYGGNFRHRIDSAQDLICVFICRQRGTEILVLCFNTTSAVC